MTVADLYWLQHCTSWFAFHEPARFEPHKDGGLFVSQATGLPIQSVIRNGVADPARGLALGATQSEDA